LLTHNDLRRADSCRALIRETHDLYGRVGILANVAGLLRRIDFLSVSEEEFDLTYQVVVKSQFSLCQAVIPYMRAAEEAASSM
jgi:NAD(P)-dependent dehydrogenase (short-subunit alcohol dehydrogenase family)